MWSATCGRTDGQQARPGCKRRGKTVASRAAMMSNWHLRLFGFSSSESEAVSIILLPLAILPHACPASVCLSVSMVREREEIKKTTNLRLTDRWIGRGRSVLSVVLGGDLLAAQARADGRARASRMHKSSLGAFPGRSETGGAKGIGASICGRRRSSGKSGSLIRSTATTPQRSHARTVHSTNARILATVQCSGGQRRARSRSPARPTAHRPQPKT